MRLKMEAPRTIFDKTDDGNSPIYMGISYLKILAVQIDLIRQALRLAYTYDEPSIMASFNDIRTFYDLVENRTGLDSSKKKIKITSWVFIENELQQQEIEINENIKYEHWFSQVEGMIERNTNVITVGGIPQNIQARHKNNKVIVLELSRCFRELMRDANLKHLIMPEGMKDMKELTKNEWVDRDFKKEF